MESIASGERGPRLTKVLTKAWCGGFTPKSNFARAYVYEVVAAAELGLITTRSPLGEFHPYWLITVKGLTLLFKLGGNT